MHKPDRARVVYTVMTSLRLNQRSPETLSTTLRIRVDLLRSSEEQKMKEIWNNNCNNYCSKDIARYRKINCKHEHLLTMVRMQRQSKPKRDCGSLFLQSVGRTFGWLSSEAGTTPHPLAVAVQPRAWVACHSECRLRFETWSQTQSFIPFIRLKGKSMGPLALTDESLVNFGCKGMWGGGPCVTTTHITDNLSTTTGSAQDHFHHHYINM